jgi:H+-transporting ATPase
MISSASGLGDVIPADAKLIEGDYLTIDQAALTGESLPVNKKLGELAFSGSVAKQGEMVAVVTGTGANTFFGRTAKLVESAGAKSHLQEAVLQVGNFLILTAILLCAILTAVELYWGASFLRNRSGPDRCRPGNWRWPSRPRKSWVC